MKWKLQLEDGNSQVVALLAIRSLNTTYTTQGDAAIEGAANLTYPEKTFSVNGWGGTAFVLATLLSEGTLLVVAAQAAQIRPL